MRRLTVLTCILAGSLSHPARAAAPVLAELFTSQGCSSCPPADAVLDRLAERSDVVVLAWHVTYWDYLGWADTLGLADSDRRQRAHARHFGKDSVYTPQLVLGGRLDAVGSERTRIDKAIQLLQADGVPTVTVEPVAERTRVVVRGPAVERAASVWAVGYGEPVTVAIARGENRGRQLTYRRAVRDVAKLGSWQGGEAGFGLPDPAGDAGQVVIVERDDDGAVLAVLDLR